jgi:hypothetical protein
MTTHEELQSAADGLDMLDAPGRSKLTLATVQGVVERGARLAFDRSRDVPEDALGVLERCVGPLRPVTASRDHADIWSRWGAFDGAMQAWQGLQAGREGCPNPRCVELYLAHWAFAASIVARVRSEK